MKATGIVRRIDDMGRIVIPKEIRRSLGIRDGEALEIFVDEDCCIFKKYNNNSKERVLTEINNLLNDIDTDSDNLELYYLAKIFKKELEEADF